MFIEVVVEEEQLPLELLLVHLQEVLEVQAQQQVLMVLQPLFQVVAEVVLEKSLQDLMFLQELEDQVELVQVVQEQEALLELLTQVVELVDLDMDQVEQVNQVQQAVRV
tara:strand:- start:1147 stop:1473 length:327 start_codon:yes stop_codon:yes gene_type:complete